MATKIGEIAVKGASIPVYVFTVVLPETLVARTDSSAEQLIVGEDVWALTPNASGRFTVKEVAPTETEWTVTLHGKDAKTLNLV